MRSDLLESILNCLEIRETTSLLPHEETISKNLKLLKEGMLNIGHLVDPLIVDKNSNVVLDGMHRLKVLSVIECPYAACQMVDYQNENITVGTWFPSMKKNPREFLKEVKFEKVDREEMNNALESLKAPYGFFDGKEAYLLNPGNYKLFEMIEEQNYINTLFKDVEVSYIPNNEENIVREKNYFVLNRKIYSKDEILHAAKNHKPFPPKSTRHLIPGRIIRLNMKLGWLHQNRENAHSHMVEMLNARAYRSNVRKYFESVIVIY